MIKRLVISAIIAALPTFGMACGADSDCTVGDRVYRISMPETADGPTSALVFAHGYRGSAAGVMRNSGLRRLADDLGVALIAVQGIDGVWALPGRPGMPGETGQGEFTYYQDVITHATQNFDIDPDHIVATGFSAGGMMTWNLICHRSELFAGFIPMSGTFWKPEPTDCDTPPASVVHIHGNTDRTVPLPGRPIGPGHQGDVPDVIAMYAQTGGFQNEAPYTTDAVNCDMRRNADGKILNFCLFEGGHSFRLNDLRAAWDMLAEAGGV